MSVSLRDLTHENFDECINLRVREDQAGLVASNVYSLAQAQVDHEVTPLAIYDDDTMVGFLMFGLDDEDGRYWLLRLMVDYRYQGKGYARRAMEQLIERLRTRFSCPALYLSFPQRNEHAARLFLNLGFTPTGEHIGDEAVYRLALAETVSPQSESS